jgi:hypothetical protein
MPINTILFNQLGIISLTLGLIMISSVSEASQSSLIPSFEIGQSTKGLAPVTSDPEVETILRLIREPILTIWQGISSYFVDAVAIVDNYAAVQYGVGQNGGAIVLQKRNGQWSVLIKEYSLEPDQLIRTGVPPQTANRLINEMENARRERGEPQQLKRFRQTWSRVNPSIAQFLGYWQADLPNGTSSVSVFPSLIPNQVCVVRFSGFNSRMEIGQVQGNRITTPTTSFTYSVDHSFDATESLESNAYDYIAFPQPLNTWHLSQTTIRELNTAQCTLALPPN